MFEEVKAQTFKSNILKFIFIIVKDKFIVDKWPDFNIYKAGHHWPGGGILD